MPYTKCYHREMVNSSIWTFSNQIFVEVCFATIHYMYVQVTVWWSLMMTSSNGNIFRSTGHLCRKFTGHRWISRTKASDAELWCFFDLRLEFKRLSKQSWGWWFETPSRSLWRHCNVRARGLSGIGSHHRWRRRQIGTCECPPDFIPTLCIVPFSMCSMCGNNMAWKDIADRGHPPVNQLIDYHASSHASNKGYICVYTRN